MDKAVHWRREGNIALITLDRPAQYNVINKELATDFRQAILECGGDEHVRAIILTGTGNAFCAGGDLKSFAAELEAKRIGSSFESMLAIWHAALASMREMPQPVVAALNGVVAGGGLGLALACDFRSEERRVGREGRSGRRGGQSRCS